MTSKNIYDKNWFSSRLDDIDNKDGHKIKEAFEKLYECSQENKYLLILLHTGVNLTDYKKFTEMKINISMACSGYINIYYFDDFTEDQATWTNDFVISTILKWQFQGYNPVFPDWAIEGFDKFLTDLKVELDKINSK